MERKDIIKQIHSMGVDNGKQLRDAARAAQEQLDSILTRIDAEAITRVRILGCGSSFFGAINVEHAFEMLAGLPARAVEGFAFEAYQNMDLIDETPWSLASRPPAAPRHLSTRSRSANRKTR